MDNPIAGKICETLIEAAKKDRKTFDKEGDEVASFAYGKDQQDDWKSFPGGEPVFKAKVAKMAQAVDIFGPHLYPSNPTRRITPRDDVDQFTMLRMKWLEKFLNYTPSECDLYSESLYATNEAVVRGRGVMWTGLDRRRGLVRSVADSVENLLKDPDAQTERDVNWKSRCRRSPRWEFAQRYQSNKPVIWDLDADASRKSDGRGKNRDHSTEIIKYYDMYARVGLHHYKEGFELIDQERAQGLADDSPRKYVIAGDKVIWSGPWDIPWFQDNDWPCTELDLRDCVNSLWPKSPLWTGICHQRALNWVYAVYMTRMSRSFRKVLGVLEGPDGVPMNLDDLNKALYGDGDAGNIEVVRIQWKGQENVKLGDIIQELVMTAGADEFEMFWKIVSREFEEATGLYPILHQGDVGRQMRSKAEVDLKAESSKTRINYYKERVEKFQSRLARKEAIATLLVQPRDVFAKIFGKQAALEFGVPDESGQATTEYNQMIAETNAMYPEEAQPFSFDVDRAFYEADYSIESGSMRPQSPEQAQDAADIYMNQAFAALMTAGQVEPAMMGMRAWAEINRMPQQFLASIDLAVANMRAIAALPPELAAPGAPGAAAPIPGPGSAPPAPAAAAPAAMPMPMEA